MKNNLFYIVALLGVALFSSPVIAAPIPSVLGDWFSSFNLFGNSAATNSDQLAIKNTPKLPSTEASSLAVSSVKAPSTPANVAHQGPSHGSSHGAPHEGRHPGNPFNLPHIHLHPPHHEHKSHKPAGASQKPKLKPVNSKAKVDGKAESKAEKPSMGQRWKEWYNRQKSRIFS